MSWGTDKFLQAQQGANNSVLRANQAHDERMRAKWENEDRERDLAAKLAEQTLRQGDQRFAEDRRRFDTRQAQFDGLMKMLFGGGDAGQPGEVNSLRRVMGRGRGFGMPEDDGIDRRAINNSLAAYLQGRM